MNLEAFTRLEKLVIDNSPGILTTIGVVGTVTTAVLTGKAASDYTRELAEEGFWDRDYAFDRTNKAHVERAWKHFVPAVGSGVLTIAAIVGANRIGTRRAAGIAAAFALSDRAYSEYKEKVVEKLGASKEQALRDEIAQDRVNHTIGNNTVIISGLEILCLDAYTGLYFKSTKQLLDQAQNKINAEVINNSYASLTDLYNILDMPSTSVSDEVGWNYEHMLEIKYSTAMTPDDQVCMVVDYGVGTIRDYWRNH